MYVIVPTMALVAVSAWSATPKSRDPEIDELDVARFFRVFPELLGHEHVVELEVPVQVPLAVHVGERARDMAESIHAMPIRQA